ncbi:hypothetical protein ACPCIY_01415 [Streptomyces thermodiastaticus]
MRGAPRPGRVGLEAVLREETGAAPGDALPALMAGQICWIEQTVFVAIGHAVLQGRHPHEASRDVLGVLDDSEDVLSEKVLNYAVRGDG